MDFQIRHDTAAVLKPVVNAAARTLDHARIELGPDAMRIWGNSKDRVAGIDIQIPADAFDTYDVDAGNFETNLDIWQSAIRGTRKTDPVAVYTEPNEHDSFREVLAIGTDEKRVLREKGFDGPEDLESATASELVGETQYQGANETKTAEITNEEAERILFEINGSEVVIESDGEEVTEPDSRPTVRKPKREFTVPDPNIAGTATVNGRDFSKAFRAINSVSDQALVGATEGSLVLHGEGDTDEVHATPPAEVSGDDAGGVFDAEWLSTLRLSLDRKASTDLTFKLPPVHGDMEDTKHLLWAEFPIKKNGTGADVTYFLAPKILGVSADDDEDVPGEAERLEMAAPSNYSAADNVRWDAETTGGDAKAWFSLLDAKADECRLSIDSDALRTRLVDPANVMMNDVEIGKAAFDSYTWRQPAGRLHSQDGIIGLPQHRITDYLKLATKTESVRFQVDEMANFIIRTENFTARVPTIDPDSVRREPDLPGLDLPGMTQVDAESFHDGLDAVEDVADHAALIIYEGECYVFGEGDLEDAWRKVETTDGRGYSTSLYSMDYLQDYLNALPSGASETLKIVSGREFPMFMEHEVRHPAANFTMMLAPRVQNDGDKSHGVYAGDALKEHDMDPLKVKDAEPIYKINDENELIRDEPGEDLPQTPEEAAEQVRDDDEDTSDTYDPTREWDDDYGPTSETPVPLSDRVAGVEGVAPSTLARDEHHTLEDGGEVHEADLEHPDEREQFKEAVEGFYDPSEDMDGDADLFKVDHHHKAAVPEQIGDWRLKAQVDEGRPVYSKGDQELRINRSFSTDVIHRRYYVEYRNGKTFDNGTSHRETLASDLSPEEAMDVLESEALERSNPEAETDADQDDDLVEIRSPYRPLPRSAKKMLWDEYEAVSTLEADDDGRGEGVLVPERPPADFLEKYELEVVRDPTLVYDTPSGRVEIYTDPDEVNVGGTEATMTAEEATQQAEQQDRFTLEEGDPADVLGDDHSDTEETGTYDPTDEFEEIEESSDISAIGDGRRKTLDALDEKKTLDDPQSFDSLEEMKNAVREISLAHRDGRTFMAPPEKALQAIQTTWDDLPEDARQAFLNDHRLYVKIRAARNRFNDWMEKRRRRDKIPSTMEAGPSNYPTKKANKTAEYAREAKEELDEAISKIRSAANGAKQRALKSVGSSVAEQNEQKAQNKRELRRETFEKGDLAFYSTTTYGNALWGVKRVNQKSVRLRRPHGSAGMEKPMSDGEVYPEYDETRADLDSDRLKGPIPPEEIANFSAEDTDARMSDDAIAVRADTAAEAKRITFGDEWAEDNLDLDSGGGGTPAKDQPWLDELDGIGSSTYDDLVELGLSNIADAKEAYQERAVSNTWQKALNTATKQGRKSLIEAVGGDPEASMAEHMEGAREDHIQANALQGDPEVGNYLALHYEDGGGMAGTVTRVDGDEALIRVSEGSTPDRYNFATDTHTGPNGKTHAVEAVELREENAETYNEPDTPTGGYDAPDEDDLQDVLAARGINNIVAHNLAEQYDSLEAVQSAVQNADDVTNLRGVGDASALQVREAFDAGSASQVDSDSSESTTQVAPEAVEDAGTLHGRFEYQGTSEGPNLDDESPEPAGPFYYWKWDSDNMVGVYKNNEYADDDLPFTAAKWVNPRGGNPYWKHTHIAGTWEDAVEAARNTADQRVYLVESESGETYPEWEERTGGTEWEHPASLDAQETSETADDGRDEEHRKAVEAARKTNPDDDLPGPALQALKKNWSVYKRGIKEGREAAEEVEEYREEHRGEAEEAAAIINDIREAYGQDPIDFEGVDGIPEVPELGGPITEESAGLSLSFDWSADPYDPTEEV